MDSSIAESIRNEARKLLASGVSAADFSEKFFGENGRLRGLWTNEQERIELVESQLYKLLQFNLAELRSKEAKLFDRKIEK